ncbi:hypothetical protein C2G38_2046818 [Gigaspora rosea]|uniref:Uncharacterized protein n=1 Tax=Gigaspora rosea TaxID=44941 RepID=A0A397U805_9GLOM|nr:hypothetical protein C2G38_2046818 [Gigaspora rosea]
MRIVTLLLEKSLDAICSASVVYLAMVYNTLDVYEDDRDLAERAVEEALKEINDSDRKEKVSEVLSQIKIGYKNIISIKTIKVLNTPQELTLDYTREEIEKILIKFITWPCQIRMQLFIMLSRKV